MGLVFLFTALLIFLAPSPASSAGLALLEQSAQGTGLAFAGATAGYDDGSAIFFNPGSMGLDGKSVVNVSMSMISPNGKFSNEGSHISPLLGGEPTTGDNGPNGGVLGWVPVFYLVQPLGADFTAGFGINSPFGLKTEYSSSWVGRYNSIDSDLKTVMLSPALSYMPVSNVSVGVAVNVLYVDADFKQAIDFGTIGQVTLGPQTASALGLMPQSADGFARLEGDDWGVGATAGATYTYCENSRIGLAYRAPVNTTLSGPASFDVPPNAGPLTATGFFTDTHNEADLNLPDVISAGWRHEFNSRWAVLADAAWTHWARFNELRVKFDNGQPDLAVNEGWNNVWRGSLGAEFKAADDLTLRTGFTYDQDPVADARHRTPAIPGNDRYWLAAGVTYDFTRSLRAEAGYAHLFIPDADSDLTSPTGDVLIGEWDLSIDILSAQLVMRF